MATLTINLKGADGSRAAGTFRVRAWPYRGAPTLAGPSVSGDGVITTDWTSVQVEAEGDAPTLDLPANDTLPAGWGYQVEIQTQGYSPASGWLVIGDDDLTLQEAWRSPGQLGEVPGVAPGLPSGGGGGAGVEGLTRAQVDARIDALRPIAFTAALLAKLDDIENGATADQSAQEISDLLDGLLGTGWRSDHTALRTAEETRDLLDGLLGTSWRISEEGGLTQAQVDAAIDAALDALIGDDTEDVHRGEPIRRDYSLSRGEDSTTAATQSFNGVISGYTFPATFANEALAGGLIQIRVSGFANAAHVTGSEPEISFTAKFGSDSVSDVEVTQSIDPNGAFDLTFALPAAVASGSASDDDLYFALDMAVRTRGRAASGSVTVTEAVIHGTGSHEAEFETLIKRLIETGISTEAQHRQSVDSSLQQQISALRATATTAADRAKLAALVSVVTPSFDTLPFEHGAALGGPFTAAAESYAPTAADLFIRLPARKETSDNEAQTFLRQTDSSGNETDTPFSGHARASSNDGFVYGFTGLTPGLATTVVLETERTELEILHDLAELAEQVNGLADLLPPSLRQALALLSYDRSGVTSVSRTSLLSHLTLTQEELTGSAAPYSSDGIDGGNYLGAVGVSSPPDADTVLVEAYKDDSNREGLIRVEAGTLGLSVKQHTPEIPATSANERAYLHRAGSADDVYTYSHNGLSDPPEGFRGVVLDVPDSVPANTACHVEVTGERNHDGNLQRFTTTIQIGGNANIDGATGTVENFDITLQYRASTRQLVIAAAQRSAGVARIEIADYSFSAYYIANETIPAQPARTEWVPLRAGFGSTVFGFRIESGKIIVTTRSATSGLGDRFAYGDFDTGLTAADYGLEENGGGVLRFRGDYNELLKVTAGTVTSADIDALWDNAHNHEYAIGLFAATTKTEQIVRIDGAVEAEAFLVDGTAITPGGGTSPGGTVPTGSIYQLRGSANVTVINTSQGVFVDTGIAIPADAFIAFEFVDPDGNEVIYTVSRTTLVGKTAALVSAPWSKTNSISLPVAPSFATIHIGRTSANNILLAVSDETVDPMPLNVYGVVAPKGDKGDKGDPAPGPTYRSIPVEADGTTAVALAAKEHALAVKISYISTNVDERYLISIPKVALPAAGTENWPANTNNPPAPSAGRQPGIDVAYVSPNTWNVSAHDVGRTSSTTGLTTIISIHAITG